MSDKVPSVSVVMGAYNCAADIRRSAASILGQTGVELELIVIDDGSDDQTGIILNELAATDSRLRLISKSSNEGLTKALIDGCEIVRGQFIARQDVGDISLEGRLMAQAAFLDSHPQVAMAACGTRYVGPRSELLFEVSLAGAALQTALIETCSDRLRGPSHHGATMFRRAVYEQVGGYRASFLVAQDLDLWVRMSEVGDCLGMPEVMYQAGLEPGSISHRYRDLQVQAVETILESRQRRKRGEDDAVILERFEAAVRRARQRKRGRGMRGMEKARFSYFVGSMLKPRDPVAAGGYFRQTVRHWPLHWKAWLKMGLVSWRLLCGSK